MSKPFKNLCVLILLTFFSGCSTLSLRRFFNRDDIAVSLSALLKEDNPDEELKLNSINSVYFLKDRSDIIVTGKECSNENGLLLSDILYAAAVVLKNDRIPYVFIGHTQKDLKNHKEFISDMYRPVSPVPEKVISDWESKSGKRPVIIKNLDRNTHISHTLYKTDMLLKRLIHGRERLWIKDIQSFKGYLSDYIQNLFEEGKVFSIPYNNRFWLSSDTTSIDLSENHLSRPVVSLSLTPEQSFYNFSIKNSLKDSLYLEKKVEYSDVFNSKMEEIYYKYPAFNSTQSFYNLLLIFETIITEDIHTEYSLDLSKAVSYSYRNDYTVPDSINSIYESSYLEKMESIYPPRQSAFFVYSYGYLIFEGGIMLDYSSNDINHTSTDEKHKLRLKRIIDSRPDSSTVFWEF